MTSMCSHSRQPHQWRSKSMPQRPQVAHTPSASISFSPPYLFDDCLYSIDDRATDEPVNLLIRHFATWIPVRLATRKNAKREKIHKRQIFAHRQFPYKRKGCFSATHKFCLSSQAFT